MEEACAQVGFTVRIMRAVAQKRGKVAESRTSTRGISRRFRLGDSFLYVVAAPEPFVCVRVSHDMEREDGEVTELREIFWSEFLVRACS